VTLPSHMPLVVAERTLARIAKASF